MSLRKSNLNFFLSIGITGCIGFASVPIMTWIYNVNDIGIFSIYIVALSLFSNLVGMALDQGFLRDYKSDDTRTLLLSCLTPVLIAWVFLTAVCLIFFKVEISTYIFDEYYLNGLIFLFFAILMDILMRYGSVIVRMENESLFFLFISLIQSLSVLLPSFIANDIQTQLDYKNLIKFHFAGLLVCTLIYFLYLYGSGRIKIRDVSFSLIRSKRLFFYSVPLLSSIVVIWLINSFDKVSIKYFTDSYQLGLYSNAIKVAAVILLVQKGVSVVWLPMAFKKYELGKGNYFCKTSFSIFSLLCVLGFIFVCGSLPYLETLFSVEFRPALNLVPILMTYPIFFIMSEIGFVGVLFKKKTKSTIYISAITAALCILLNVILVPEYKALGAAISISVSYFTMMILRLALSDYYWIQIHSKEDVFALIIMTILSFMIYANGVNYYYLVVALLLNVLLYVNRFRKEIF